MFRLLSTYLFYFVLVSLLFSSCESHQRPSITVGSDSMVDNSSNEKVKTVESTPESYKTDTTIDPFELPLTLKVKGSHLKAISVALDAFKTDGMIPENKKYIDNYDIELRQNKDDFFVYFSPYSTKDDTIVARDGGESTLGKSVMFIIGKKDFQIKRRYFFM